MIEKPMIYRVDTETNISQQGRAGFWILDHSKPELRKMHQDYFFVYVENVDLNSLQRKYNYKAHERKKDTNRRTQTCAGCSQALVTQILSL
jgi:hypothetical protein